MSGPAIDYGTDLSCTNDLTPLMTEVSGIQTLSEALYRRFITPRGANIYDPNYGYDLQTLLNDDLSPVNLGPYTTSIQNECLKDQRVQNATAVLQLLSNGVLIVTITITSGLGPFTLVLSVTALSVTILQQAA